MANFKTTLSWTESPVVPRGKMPKIIEQSIDVLVGDSDGLRRMILSPDPRTIAALEVMKGEQVLVEVAHSHSVVARDENGRFYLVPTFLLKANNILNQFRMLVKETDVSLEAAFTLCKI